ncbi:MAG: response regulator [Anaerolineae bacterium]|jgi:DNA-binding NarL/FixJ family response regulator
MADERALTLIVVRAGPLRDGIEALLASVPQVQIVGKAGSASRALRMVAQHSLDLLVVDVGLPGNRIWQLLRACSGGHKGIRCIALADNDEQGQVAKGAGADAVLLKGFAADRLAETVERLLKD